MACFSNQILKHFPSVVLISSPALYVPDPEDSGDAPVSSLSLQVPPELVPETVDRSAVRCPLLDQEGACTVLSEDVDDFKSSCQSRLRACEGTIPLSSGPVGRKHRESNRMTINSQKLVTGCGRVMLDLSSPATWLESTGVSTS